MVNLVTHFIVLQWNPLVPGWFWRY